MNLEEHDERIDKLESLVGGHESDGMREAISSAGEALQIVKRILADLVDAANVDADEYAEDLTRLQTLAAMVKFN